jgi:hypothetical protein
VLSKWRAFPDGEGVYLLSMTDGLRSCLWFDSSVLRLIFPTILTHTGIFISMRGTKLKLQEQINRIHELSGSNMISGKNLIVVDIQPEYSSGFDYFIHDFVEFLNTNYESLNSLTFLYNGADTLDMISESDYKNWWWENGLNEDIAFNVTYYDKGYAFFRYCIDSGIDDESTTNLVKFMIRKNVNDSRELGEEFWNEFIDIYGSHDVRGLLEVSNDMVNIPDLMDFLARYNNIILCGGGVDECLKEVEIALNALDKPYNVLTKYVY